MIHVVQVLSDTNIGGAGRYLLNYLHHYDKESFTVTVVLPEKSKLIDYIKDIPEVTVIEAPYMADQSFNRKCIKYLTNLFKNIKPQMVHTHACLSARIAASRAGVPKIFATRHCIEPLHYGVKGFVKGMANNLFCHCYIAVSQAVKKNLVAEGVKRESIRVVNNGVIPIKTLPDAEKEKLREKYGISPQDTVFSIFARLEPVKGHKYFIKAARQVLKETENAKFLIVGDGSLSEELKLQVLRYGLRDKIIFTGFIPDTTPLLNITDVNVCTSESEAMSLSILEAMSLGVPTIATKVGGNTELIDNNQNGITVGYADSASLALAMLRMICNKEVQTSFGKNAKLKYDVNYTVEKMVADLEKVYKEVLS